MKNRLTTAKIGGIFFLIAILSIISLADDKTNRVDKLFDLWDTTISPGASLAIIHNGEIIYKRGYGMANLEQNIPITPETVFRIGSTSKQFTAACIGILVSQSKISLDDDIRKYIPELPQYEKPITVRHLIHHTSGLRDYLELEYLAGKLEDDFFTPEDTVALLSRQKGLNFVPGDEYLYSNSGYFLLGVIVSRVSGKSLNEFAQEHIFKLLGMKNTHFHDDYTMIVKGRADGHTQTKYGFKINNTTLNHVGDGGVFTTVEDLYLWDQTFYNEILGKELIELMHQTGSLNNGEKLEYAFGLRVSNYKGLKMVAHGGAWVGFRAEMIRFPEEKFTVICLANLASINPSQLCRQIADIYLADKFTATEPAEKAVEEIKPVALTKEELDNKIGMFIATRGLSLVEFSVEGDNLVIETRGEKFRLIPVSPSKFVTKDAPEDITVEFWPPDREAQNAKVTVAGEREINLKRTPKIAPLTTEELKDYSGFYYSEELPATYKLVVEDDKLVFKHRNSPEKPLKMIDKDNFLSEYGKLEFKREKRGKITGFYLDAGRVRIQFTKI